MVRKPSPGRPKGRARRRAKTRTKTVKKDPIFVDGERPRIRDEFQPPGELFGCIGIGQDLSDRLTLSKDFELAAKRLGVVTP